MLHIPYIPWQISLLRLAFISSGIHTPTILRIAGQVNPLTKNLKIGIGFQNLKRLTPTNPSTSRKPTAYKIDILEVEGKSILDVEDTMTAIAKTFFDPKLEVIQIPIS